MIITIPVLYRANIVKVGHRNPEDCLLSAQVPVRLNEGVPPLAISLEDNARDYGDGGYRVKPGMLPGPSSWYEVDGQLVGEFSARLSGRDLAMWRQTGAPNSIAAIGSGEQKWMVRPTGQDEGYEMAPWISRSATAAGEGSIAGDVGTVALPVYDEGIATRSRTLASPEGRDIAIAHASRTFRSMMLNDETGELLVPSIGPIILAASRPMRIVSYRPDIALPHCHSAVEFDQALAFNQERWRNLPTVPPIQSLTVLRPDLVTWDAAASSIVACASTLGMGPMNGDSWRDAWGVMGGGMAMTNMSRLFGSALERLKEPGSMAFFSDFRSPSDRTVEIAIQAVELAVMAQKRVACDFVDMPDNAALNPMALLCNEYALSRVSHLRLENRIEPTFS